MRILITGAQTGNKGSQSMLYTVMDQLRKRYGDVEIDIIPGDSYIRYVNGNHRFNVVYYRHLRENLTRLPLPLRQLALEAKACRFRCNLRALPSLRKMRSINAAMPKVDAVINVSGFALSSNFPVPNNRFFLNSIELAKHLGKKVILLPQSYGPFDYGQHQAEMDEAIPRILSRADLLYAREADGKRMLEEKYGLTNVRLAPDIVLQTGEADWRNITRTEPRRRVPKLTTERNVAIVPNIKTFEHGDGEVILESYSRIIEALLGAGKQVYIFRHSGDLDACQRVYAPFEGREGVTLIEREFNCWEYCDFVEQFDFIIASRFHAVVHAYKRGIPALILGWAVKYQELAERFGQADYAFDITRSCDTGAILSALRRLDERRGAESAKIRAALAELQNQNCFSECWKILDAIEAPKAAPAPAEAPAALRNVSFVRERGLCSACGVCAANCPKNCITMVREGNEVLPRVDEAACAHCGRCLEICSVQQMDEYEPGTDLCRHLLGEHRSILCVRAKDEALLADSTSGGLVTQLVRALLDGGDYDSAFLVDGYDYAEPAATRRFTAGDDLSSTPGSRYLTVSHEAAARHMIAHPEERVVLVATPCAAQALRNAMALHRLNRENYLLIGLFCEKTMHYGVVEYFSRHPRGRGRALRGLRFRTKRIAGWPGDLRMEYADGSCEDLPRTERMQVKEYFMPERCLYCLDKLNRGCDIAVGDNYIKGNSDKLGANSCILRTARGEAVWNKYRDLFLWHEDDADALIRAQHLKDKQQSFLNASLKGFYESTRLSTAAAHAYGAALQRIEVGRAQNPYRAVQRDLRRRRLRQKLKKLLRGRRK